MEGYQQGGGGWRIGEKIQGVKQHKWQVENRQGEVKNSMGKGETV